MKKIWKIFLSFIVILFLFFGLLKYFVLSKKNISNFIKTQFLELTGDNITFSNFFLTYNKGILLKVNNLKIFNKDKTILKIESSSALIDIKKILKRKIYFKKIKIENGNIILDANKLIEKAKKKNKKSITSKKSGEKFKIFFKNISIKNLNINSKISKERVKLYLKKLQLKNFSLNKNFSFKLDSMLIVKNSKGQIIANGNVFLPDAKINAKIFAKNLNLEFLKFLGIKISNCNINGNISGSFKHNILSHLNISAKKVSLIKYYNLDFNKLDLNINFKVNKKTVLIKRSVLDIDNNSIELTAFGKLDNFKNINLAFFTNKISISYINHFIPKKFNVKIFNKGFFQIKRSFYQAKLDNFANSNIDINFALSGLSGKFKNFSLDNLSFFGNVNKDSIKIKNIKASINNTSIESLNLTFKNKALIGNGNLKVDISDIPELDKFLTLHKGILNLSLKHFYIPFKNFNKTKLKFSGTYSMKNGLIAYDFFKKIKIKRFQGNFNEKIINLKNSDVNFRGNDYQLKGNVKHYMVNPVTFDFDISSNIFDRFIADNLLKIKIGTCKNIDVKVHLSGIINPKFHISLTNGKIKFLNSNVNIEGFKFKNIQGEADLVNDIATLKNISFKFNNGNYTINGTVSSPFKDKILNIFIQTNKIDKILTSKLKINELKNLTVNANIAGTFNKIFLKSATINLNGTNLYFQNYKIRNLKGVIKYKDNVASLDNLSFYLDKIKYFAKGKIFYPFENLSYSLNIQTDSIDSIFLKMIKLNFPTIKNVDVNMNISGNLNKKLNFHFDNSYIIFKNSNINKNIKSITGKIFLNKDKVTFDNLKGNFLKGDVEFKGYINIGSDIKKGYFNIDGKGLDLRELKLKSEKKDNKKIKKLKKEKIKKIHFMKKLYNSVKNIDIQISGKFFNIKSEKEVFKNILVDIKIDKKGIFIKDCKISNNKKGYFLMKKAHIQFGDINKFILSVKYHNINIGDIFNFLIPKKSFEFYGNAKNCYIELQSKFKKFNNFEKNLNGKFNINYKDGFINKVPMIANIFSLLNVAQIFKFKLPDLNIHGFNYSSLKGSFNVKNGIIKTKSLKLDSDSINLIYFGDINLVKKVFNAHLLVYPLKTVDTILKHIPLIGYLLSGKKGSGTIVTYFNIEGPLDSPKIHIQPAKTVTKKVESVIKNIIKLPFTIFTHPKEILVPNTK